MCIHIISSTELYQFNLFCIYLAFSFATFLCHSFEDIFAYVWKLGGVCLTDKLWQRASQVGWPKTVSKIEKKACFLASQASLLPPIFHFAMCHEHKAVKIVKSLPISVDILQLLLTFDLNCLIYG